MKRIIFAILAVLMFMSPLPCFAAGSSVSYSSNQNLDNVMRTVTLAWVGDDTSGAIPAKSTDELTITGTAQTVTSFIQGYYLCDVEVNPGTAPTASYDIAITDAGGASLTNGALDDLSASSTEIRRMAGYSGPSNTWMGCHYVSGPLTITWSNTTAVSSTGTLKLYLSR